MDGILVVSGLQDMEAAAREGRSLVAAQAHARINFFWRDVLDPLAVKSTTFAATSRATGRTERNRMVPTFGNGAQLGFLKVAKAIRQGQHLVRIFPDGPAGGDRIGGSILGLPASIGAGAARLAWMAGAATFFLGSRWLDDARLELYAVPGPVAEEGVAREVFEDAFAAFYFDRLNEIANGDAANMAGAGATWANTTRTGPQAFGDVA